MARSAFDQIRQGLDEALAFARGEAGAVRLHDNPGIDVRSVRDKTGLTDQEFADRFGFDVDDIRRWEAGLARPLHGLQAYLLLISDNPAHVTDVLDRQHNATGRRDKP